MSRRARPKCTSLGNSHATITNSKHIKVRGLPLSMMQKHQKQEPIRRSTIPKLIPPVTDATPGPIYYCGSEGGEAAAIKSETLASSAASRTAAACSSTMRGTWASSSAIRAVAATRFRSSVDVSGHSHELELQKSVRPNKYRKGIWRCIRKQKFTDLRIEWSASSKLVVELDKCDNCSSCFMLKTCQCIQPTKAIFFKKVCVH
jgi:hypothetical protein